MPFAKASGRSRRTEMSLLQGFRVVQIGEGVAAAVCGRLFADVGADVSCVEPDISTPFAAYLNHGKSDVADDTAVRRNAIAVPPVARVLGRVRTGMPESPSPVSPFCP